MDIVINLHKISAVGSLHYCDERSVEAMRMMIMVYARPRYYEMEQPAWDGTTCKISSKLTFTISSPGTFTRDTKTSGIFAFCCRHFRRPTKLTLLGEKMNIFKEAQLLQIYLTIFLNCFEKFGCIAKSTTNVWEELNFIDPFCTRRLIGQSGGQLLSSNVQRSK